MEREPGSAVVSAKCRCPRGRVAWYLFVSLYFGYAAHSCGGQGQGPLGGHFRAEILEVLVRVVLTGVRESLLVWARCRGAWGFQWGALTAAASPLPAEGQLGAHRWLLLQSIHRHLSLPLCWPPGFEIGVLRDCLLCPYVSLIPQAFLLKLTASAKEFWISEALGQL